MATKRKTKKTTKKTTKKYYSTKKKTNTVRSSVNFGLGFPKKCLMKHKYVDMVDMTSTNSATAFRYFSCNGMYDPDYSGGGHQPYYFDQMTPLYDHYCVIGSKCTLRIVPETNTTSTFSVALYVNDDTSSNYSYPQQAAENGTGRVKIFSPFTMGASSILSTKWSAKKYFGKNPLANTDLQGTSAANPTEQSYFTIVMASNAPATTTKCYFEVIIEYIAVWKELKDVYTS